MKSVLLSIKPYWLFLIIAKQTGWKVHKEKTVEVRKNYPKDENWNKKVLLYCTKDRHSFNQIPEEYQLFMKKFLGKVIGEFVCDFINKYTAEFVDDDCYEDIRQIWEDDDFTIVTSNEDENPNNCFLCNASCLSFEDIKKYIGVNFHEIPFYAWHISDLKIYGTPKSLDEFEKPCPYSYDCTMCKYHFDGSFDEPPHCDLENFGVIKRPPQSWCYLEELK